MIRFIPFVLLIFLLFGCTNENSAKADMIELSQLEEMVTQMEKEYGWDVKSDLLWGYFFTDKESDKLRLVAEHLESMGYRVVSINSDDNGNLYWLHVEKIETHTPQSLDKRNKEFYKLAEDFNLESYDGMDVGLAP